MRWKNKKGENGVFTTRLCVFLWQKTSVRTGITICLRGWALESQERVIKKLCLCLRVCIFIHVSVCRSVYVSELVTNKSKSLSFLVDNITNTGTDTERAIVGVYVCKCVWGWEVNLLSNIKQEFQL